MGPKLVKEGRRAVSGGLSTTALLLYLRSGDTYPSVSRPRPRASGERGSPLDNHPLIVATTAFANAPQSFCQGPLDRTARSPVPSAVLTPACPRIPHSLSDRPASLIGVSSAPWSQGYSMNLRSYYRLVNPILDRASGRGDEHTVPSDMCFMEWADCGQRGEVSNYICTGRIEIAVPVPWHTARHSEDGKLTYTRSACF
jgi:hypothetical protein